jgi:hypothetical protein
LWIRRCGEGGDGFFEGGDAGFKGGEGWVHYF